MSGRLLTHVREDLRDTPTLPEVLAGPVVPLSPER